MDPPAAQAIVHVTPWPLWSRLLLGAVLALMALMALYGAVLAVLWRGQERLLFAPETLPADHAFAVPPDVHESALDVPGARLSVLHLRLPAPDGFVFFLHGNGGSLDNWFVNTEFYRRANLDLYMIDYRGYGKSSGRIESQAQLQADVRAAWDSVAPQYAGRKRVIYGRSLGSGLAALLAADVQPDLTILASPYTSMAAIAAEQYPWVPSVLLRYPLRTDEALMRVRGPVLLVHGARDVLIPPRHSQRLFAQLPRAQVRLLLVPQAGHGDLQQFPAYVDGLHDALVAKAPAAP